MRAFPRRLAALFIPLLLNACSGGGGASSAQVISVTITGSVRYEDKLYGTAGFTGNTELKPVRHAKVELVGDQGVVANGSTDESGGYAISGSGSNLYVRVLAQTDGTGTSHPVEVVNANNPSQIYAVPSSTLSAGDSTVNLDITLAAAGTVAGVFNILDVYQSAGEFTYSNTQGRTGLPPLQVRWAECSTNGTYTSNYGSYTVIALLGVHSACPVLNDPTYRGGIDTDEYDDDVMWHEYGHYLEFAYGTDDNPGYPHTLTDLNQDLRLAWSEGWGDFLSGAVKEWLVNTHPERLSIATTAATSWYVDTYGTSAFGYDFRNGTLQGTQLLYASNEGAVGKILWGINDDAVMDFATIWGVFTEQLSQTTPTNVIATLESVWDGWLAQYSPSPADKTAMRTILNDRAVYYQDDPSEPDDTLATAQALRPTPAFYTLFRNDGLEVDFDWIPFNVTNGNTYLIETYGLHNGADTYLRILDSNGNQVFANDDYYENDPSLYQPPQDPSTPDTCRYSSRVLFTANVSPQTFYAEVSSSTNRPLGTGRFGDYQLAITENPPLSPPYQCP